MPPPSQTNAQAVTTQDWSLLGLTNSGWNAKPVGNRCKDFEFGIDQVGLSGATIVMRLRVSGLTSACAAKLPKLTAPE